MCKMLNGIISLEHYSHIGTLLHGTSALLGSYGCNLRSFDDGYVLSVAVS